MTKEILINQLFSGRYLNEGENIGHEVINLFSDDDGNHNLYVTPSGLVKDHELECILFVRNISSRKTVEVVGLAKGIKSITEDEINGVRYAGGSLVQIFSNNTYHGIKEPYTNHITYRADIFLRPSRRIFITVEDYYNPEEYVMRLDSERKVITPQGLREYYSEDKDSKAYEELKALIENRDLWDEKNTTDKLIPDGMGKNKNPSFLEIIRKEDDENIFSNLLGYYFEYSHPLFQRFAENSNLLDIADISVSFTIYRESMGRVDLWIECENDIIIIENKIKSGINGVSSDDYSQLNKYYELAEKEAAKSGKRTHYYLFAPDYARFDLSQFGLNNVFKIIRYSAIYKFFVDNAEIYIADKFFPDFLRGLKRHALSFPELQFEIMRSRLLNKINLLQ